MSARCRYEGCTVGETGRCALENDLKTCPNLIGAVVGEDGDAGPHEAVTVETAGLPVLPSPERSPSFPPSTSLGPNEVEEMMRRRYVTVVGIVGDPEAGKTACLASLYLLISNAMLDGWSFADSSTLMAFEEISRGARRWHDGHPPDEMTVHTEMADERRPGFLHLRLRRDSDDRCIDLALPDLPGEWTKSLVRSSRSDRFEFLKAADVIWLLIDGRTLTDREKRQGTITRLGQLAARLRALITDAFPRLLLVITHQDLGATPENILSRIADEFKKHGVTAEVVGTAPFSDDENTKAGFGLASLIDATTASRNSALRFWPASPPRQSSRTFLNYRRDQ